MGGAGPDKVAWDGETLKPPELWFLHTSKCDFWQSGEAVKTGWRPWDLAV